MAEVTLEGVVKRFGDSQVIHGIDLAVVDGELIVIVGPSGCGKSTLLRMVAGLETITEGRISIGGRMVNDLEPKDRDIAMVFQTYALYPHMTVYDNMAYGLRIAGQSKAEIDERVRRAARMLELDRLLARKPRQLSGGQRQRVAMGRAIVRDPAVFLFDEPLSNLDAKLRVQMRLEIKELQRSLGTTSLYVTHDQVEAMTLADRLVVMNDGVAEQIAAPLDVYARPETRFVAGFIGSPAMNFLPGRITNDGAGVALDAGSVLPLRDAALPALAGRGVILGLRPEHLEPAEGETADLHLAVRLVETLGADLLAHGALDGAAASLVTVRLSGAARVREKDVLPLRLAPGAVHLFDPETGRRVEG